MNKEERDKLIRETVHEQLRLPYCGNFPHPNDLKPENNIRDDLGADSLDEIEILMEMEIVFNIEIDDERAEQVKTIGDIYQLADKMAGEK